MNNWKLWNKLNLLTGKVLRFNFFFKAAALKQAFETQKVMMKDVNIDDIDDLKDEMEEMKWESDQINDTLNRNYDLDVDEEELEAEMREIDDDLFREQLQKPQNNQAPNYYQSVMKSQAANINKI